MTASADLDNSAIDFRVRLLDNMLSILIPIVACLSGGFLLTPASLMEKETTSFCAILCAGISIGFALAARLLHSGRWVLARFLSVWIATVGVAAAIHFTGGVFASVATPTVILPAMIVLCLYEMPKYWWMCIVVLFPVTSFEIISHVFAISLSNLTSKSNSVWNLLVVISACYVVLCSTLGAMASANRKMQIELAKERDRQSIIAHTDALTGVANRLDFETRVKEVLLRGDQSRGIATLYIDLNDFKSINDNFGHAIGDAVLIQISQRLVNFFPEALCVARLGGDEFAVLLDGDVNHADLQYAVTSLREAIAAPMENLRDELCVSAAIGYAKSNDGIFDFGSLLNVADQRMYADKMKKRLGILSHHQQAA